MNFNEVSKNSSTSPLDSLKTEQECRILVVDDDESISSGVRDFLIKNGFKVLVGNNGQQGLDLWLNNRDIQIILTDMIMPMMTGIELIKEIRKIDSTVHIVVLSGVTAVESVVDCLRFGANNFLEKPFKPKQVLAAIREQLAEIESDAIEREQTIINQILIEAGQLASNTQMSSSELAEGISNLLNDCFQSSVIALLVARHGQDDIEIVASSHSNILGKSTPQLNENDLKEWMLGLLPETRFLVKKITNKNDLKGYLVLSKDQTLFQKENRLESFLNQLTRKLGFLFEHLQYALSIDETQPEKTSPKLLQLAMVGEISASVVHDIANPLTVANYYLQKLQKQDCLDATGQVCIEKIVKSVNLVTNIVQSFNHLMTGGKQAPRSVATLHSILESGIFVLAHKITKNKANVLIECNPTESIDCVKSQIEQVVINLLSNAIDAIEKVGNKEIILRAKMIDGTTAMFEICNHGPLIPQEVKDRIFQKFFTTKPTGKGTGLGLYISNNIVSSYGGEISCLDDELKRTVFRFTIKQQ